MYGSGLAMLIFYFLCFAFVSVRCYQDYSVDIHDCKKNDKPVDFYHFHVKLKTRMVIEEYRSELYNRKLDFLVKW